MRNMSQERNLYVMISCTNTGIGKAIRMFSRYTYNHVALTLDPTFRTWVSFARYIHNAPLFGGFIMEPVERYLVDDEKNPVMVRIFKLDITEKEYLELDKLFSKAGDLDSKLVYNIFDIIAASIKQKVSISDAYTCLGFARAVLKKDYPDIKSLDDDLQNYKIFDGKLSNIASDSGDRSDKYFSKLSLIQGTKHTVKQIVILTSRVVNKDRDDSLSNHIN